MIFKSKACLAVLATLAMSSSLMLPALARGGSNMQTVQIELRNFATEQAKLRHQISSAVNAGGMARQQAAQFIEQLDQLNAEAQNAAASGTLSDQQAWGISDQYNQIQDEINSVGAYANSYANPYGNQYANPYGYRYSNPYGYRYSRPRYGASRWNPYW